MRKQLSKSDIKELNEKLKVFGIMDFFDKKDKVEEIKGHESNLDMISVNGEVSFFYSEGRLIPTVRLLLRRMVLPQVEVDMGAIRFVVSGADIMRPGILKVPEEQPKGAYVAIVDVNNKKCLAVGELLFSGKEIREMDKGKVIKNLHYVGDKVWNLMN